MQNYREQLTSLANLVACGHLTKGSHIDAQTLVCFTQANQDGGVTYFQLPFEKLRPDLQKIFKGMRVGQKAYSWKITGVWDAWDSQDKLAPRIKMPANQ